MSTPRGSPNPFHDSDLELIEERFFEPPASPECSVTEDGSVTEEVDRANLKTLSLWEIILLRKNVRASISRHSPKTIEEICDFQSLKSVLHELIPAPQLNGDEEVYVRIVIDSIFERMRDID